MSTPRPPRSRSSRRGTALIVVLASVALLLILTVAFLSSVGTELRSSKMYANSASVKLLGQTAVNLAIGQIRVATGDPSLCWASQPGMIRTYDSNGNPAGYYKLYSDDNMQGAGQFNHNLAANSVPADWYSQKGIYVDLNQPVAVNGTPYYPIVEGDTNRLGAYTSALDGSVLGMKPITAGAPSVGGFSLKQAPSTPVDATSPNLAPMPVKWLYVLQDGQAILPDVGSGGTNPVKFTNAGTKPSTTNPIVGRLAFWTDDDTCKVNVNTASEGSFWDTPRCYTAEDFYYAVKQPLANEFQRYPGHPATVSLSTIFPSILSATPDSIYNLTPRTSPGGSMGGTVGTVGTITQPLPVKTDRLYASADEFVFQMNLNASGERMQNTALLGNTATDPDAVRKSKFFLTAHSQAPDVNVFNLPRISVWPITLNKATGVPVMSPYDKIAAFCGTLNQHPFYFERKDPTSPTTDLPTGGTSTGLGRNRQLLEYLRTLTSKPVPGFGPKSFEDKLTTSDRDQVLVEMFDYIRSTNLQDSSTGATIYAAALDGAGGPGAGRGQVVPIVDNGAPNVVDARNGGAQKPRGFGRFPTLHEAALIFISAGDQTTNTRVLDQVAAGKQRVQAALVLQLFDPSQGVAITRPWYRVRVLGLENMEWSADGALFFNMGFNSAPAAVKPYTSAILGQSCGGIIDFRQTNYAQGATYPFISGKTGISGAVCPDMNTGGFFTFRCNGTITVAIDALDSTGVTATQVQTVKLTFPQGQAPVPTAIPLAETELITAAPPSAYGFLSFSNYKDQLTGKTLSGRLNFASSQIWISKMDAIRGVVATPGDMRLIAARSDVAVSYFQPVTQPAASNYYTATVPMSHMLRFGINYAVWGGTGGRLVNAPYDRYTGATTLTHWYDKNDSSYLKAGAAALISFWPTKDTDVPNILPPAVPPVPMDWDTGFQNARDGTYINKPDEGDEGQGTSNVAYYGMDYNDGSPPGPTFFSANRMIPSPGMFGSLPSGVWRDKPFQTLLFRPGPAGHPGLGSPGPSGATPAAPPYTAAPPDHLLLDLFNMPVVEPYAISTPLATAGRINMNSLIVPFTYINRDTGLRAAMKAQKVEVIKVATLSGGGPVASTTYKRGQNPNWNYVSGAGNPPTTFQTRFDIDVDATLKQFRARFDSGDIFHSASEICSIDLIPKGAPGLPTTINRGTMDTFWVSGNAGMTGDNVRERPYTNLYPLLTTKSNTYTVHYRVQLLKQVAGGDATQWREGKDVITGQYRGSQTIERYIDPNDTIPDYADPTILNATTFPPAEPLSKFYKIRVVSTSQFAP